MTVYGTVTTRLPQEQWHTCDVCGGTGEVGSDMCPNSHCDHGVVKTADRRASSRDIERARSSRLQQEQIRRMRSGGDDDQVL